MSGASLTHSTTKVAQYGIVQVQCQFDSVLYQNLDDLVTNDQRTRFHTLYSLSPYPSDKTINQGDILFVLAPSFRNMGGGLYDSQATTRKYTQDPLVGSHLGGFAIPLTKVPGGKPDLLKNKLAFTALMHEMIVPFGVALKTLKMPHTAGMPKDPPIAVKFGTMSIVNIGIKDIAVGDPIYAEVPMPDQSPTIVDMKNGFTKGMRKLIPVPYHGEPTRTTRWLQIFFDALTGAQVIATRVLKKPVVTPENEFLLTQMEEHVRSIVVAHEHAQWWRTTTNAGTVVTAEASNKHYGDAWTKYTLGEDKRYIQELACAAPTPERALLSERNKGRAISALDLLLGALSHSFAMAQKWFMGYAMTAAKPGHRFDIYLTGR